MLAEVLQAVCETLRLPSASLHVEDGAEVAAYGPPSAASESIPLEHEGQQVGALLVSRRTGEQTLGAADRRVLEVLAVPVAVALHAVLLSQELQRSRERLVAAREEERRRLRRDLHDGLGPTLTAVTLKADAARSVLAAAPDRADGLLAELRGDAKQAIGDLRRIIYDLRPASLDELGLLGALGEQVDRFARQGLSVTLQAPPALPVLPAAVEVAAYRIVTEALANIARHAHAGRATVTVSVDDGFCLDVQDDGNASTVNGHGWRPGVGLGVHGRARRRGRRHPPGRPHPRRRPGPGKLAIGAGMTIRVLVADDHPLVREGLKAALAPLPEVEIVAEAATGQAAIREAVLHQPDVVVMDLQMPDLNGIDATRELARAVPLAAVLVLTMFDDDDWVFAAMRAGARGYVLKGAEQQEIARAIMAVAAGEAIFGPAVATRVLAYFATPPVTPTPFPELTVREREVLDLLAAGRNNRQIAEQLGLSAKTVANHISAIFAKLQVADRTQAILRARDAGLGHT